MITQDNSVKRFTVQKTDRGWIVPRDGGGAWDREYEALIYADLRNRGVDAVRAYMAVDLEVTQFRNMPGMTEYFLAACSDGLRGFWGVGETEAAAMAAFRKSGGRTKDPTNVYLIIQLRREPIPHIDREGYLCHYGKRTCVAMYRQGKRETPEELSQFLPAIKR